MPAACIAYFIQKPCKVVLLRSTDGEERRGEEREAQEMMKSAGDDQESRRRARNPVALTADEDAYSNPNCVPCSFQRREPRWRGRSDVSRGSHTHTRALTYTKTDSILRPLGICEIPDFQNTHVRLLSREMIKVPT